MPLRNEAGQIIEWFGTVTDITERKRLDEEREQLLGGIPEDKQEAIFEEYTRLDPEAQQGAGIGLAISRRIARLLGGDLTVESTVGRGATFTIWLPPAASK